VEISRRPFEDGEMEEEDEEEFDEPKTGCWTIL
jgi:hypothetical protein